MTTPQKSSPWYTLLIGLALVGGGGGLAWYGQGLVDRALKSVTWPQAPGVVLSSRVATKQEKGKTKYWAVVSYEFESQGQKRTGSTISFGGSKSSSRLEYDKIVAKYPAGKAVQVYHDPSNPDINVLEPGITLATRVPQFFGYVLLAVGLAMVGYPAVAWAMSTPEPPEVMTPE